MHTWLHNCLYVLIQRDAWELHAACIPIVSGHVDVKRSFGFYPKRCLAPLATDETPRRIHSYKAFDEHTSYWTRPYVLLNTSYPFNLGSDLGSQRVQERVKQANDYYGSRAKPGILHEMYLCLVTCLYPTIMPGEVRISIMHDKDIWYLQLTYV